MLTAGVFAACFLAGMFIGAVVLFARNVVLVRRRLAWRDYDREMNALCVCGHQRRYHWGNTFCREGMYDRTGASGECPCGVFRAWSESY